MIPDFDAGTGTQCFDKCEFVTSERKIDKFVMGHSESEQRLWEAKQFVANDDGKAKPLRFFSKEKTSQDTGKNCSCQRCQLSTCALFVLLDFVRERLNRLTIVKKL